VGSLFGEMLMYGILTDEDEQVDALLPTKERPVAHRDSTTLVADARGLVLTEDNAAPEQSRAIPSEEAEPSGTTFAKYVFRATSTQKPTRRSRGPERLVVDDGDERISLILPLLRVIAQSDIEAKAGKVMAAVLRERAERQVSRGSAIK
jgi:hypothetical protein